MFNKLYTKEGLSLSQTPWNEYPRPSLRRAKWLCLNGLWQFEANGVQKQDILVPFPPESLLSGIGEVCNHLKYTCPFTLDKDFLAGRVILHFGAVDQIAKVYINETQVGEHEGGYLPFSFDITSYIHNGENTITLVAQDLLDKKYPIGKQKLDRGGMWYTPVSGIWQTVWIEPVPQEYIKGINYTVDGNNIRIDIDGVQNGTIILLDKEYQFSNGSCNITIDEPIYWSPENPHLYYFTVTSGTDRVESYFALRTLSIKNINGKPRICLNGEPYFFHGVLDQGYFSDGIYLPATPKLYEDDILAMKKLGFNTLRKHIKIEPEYFYHACDRLGIIVFQDMVNNGEYSFVRDTILPTIGIQRISDKFLNKNKTSRAFFIQHMKDTVAHLKKFACIALWTIFNEAWGQFTADKCYDILKSIDNTRIIDATSGWFWQKKSDVDSKHIYFKPLKLNFSSRPMLLSEYGGYVWKLDEHSFNTTKTYGYRIYKTREEMTQGVRKLLDELLQLTKKGLCGAIYTQLSDVEDETNGILTYDRVVCKIDESEIADYGAKLQSAVKQ